MTPADRAFYDEEELVYAGLWKTRISADVAASWVHRVLAACGEPSVPVLVLPHERTHRAYPDRIEFAGLRLTPLCVIHETAHVIEFRGGGVYTPDHDADFWNLVALVACVLEEVL